MLSVLWGLALALAVLLGVCTPRAAAQCPPGWVPGGSYPGVSGLVYALAVLPDGDVIVGGNFSTAGGVPANSIARYNPTTNSWSALASGLTDVFFRVRAIAVLPGGDVIVGGGFSRVGGVSTSNIARYNFTTNTWSALGTGVNSQIDALAVLPGGDVIAGGNFTFAGEVSTSYVARYTPTTDTWSALGSGVGGVTTPNVAALAVLPGGDVIVGGYFTNAGGVPATSIARYNPTTDTWSALGSGVSGTVYALSVLPGGDVIVGGNFTTAGGVPASDVARYNPTTNAWSALGSGVSNSTVNAIAVLPGGDVIVGGNFTTAGIVQASKIARYNLATNTWSALGSGLSGPSLFSVFVSALVVLPGGDVIVGGYFDTAGGMSAIGIARYNLATNMWSALGSGLNGTVYAVAVLPGGDVIVGGDFISAGGVLARRIARYNPATNAWSALGSGTARLGGYDSVRALAVLPSGDVIVAGLFDTAGGVPAGNIARYNPTTNTWSALGSGVDQWVHVLAVLPGGDVLAGGDFTHAGIAMPANHIARYNPTTNTWSALGSGVGGPEFPDVFALAVLPGGDVIVGGDFTTAGGVPASNIARYTPTTNTWSELGSGVNNTVSSLVVLPGGNVVVAGGAFTTAGGSPAYYIARYYPATNAWLALGSRLNGGVGALAVLPGGDVIVGGGFTYAGLLMPANRIARYSPVTNTWSALGSGVGSFQFPDVRALAVLPSGDVIVGGDFLSAGGNLSAFFARYSFNRSAPGITDEPRGVVTCPTGTAAFSVTATGTAPLSYRWRKGGVNLVNGPTGTGSTIAGAAAGTLTISNVSASDSGAGVSGYDCVVTNVCGSVTSNAATLTVCVADVDNGSGTGTCDRGVTIDDLLYYILLFTDGNIRADVDDGTSTGTRDGGVTIDDLLYYLLRLDAGC